MMWPRIGSPLSPITGLRSLPAGGSAQACWGQSWASSRFSTIPMPGTVRKGDVVNRRFAWSSR